MQLQESSQRPSGPRPLSGAIARPPEVERARPAYQSKLSRGLSAALTSFGPVIEHLLDADKPSRTLESVYAVTKLTPDEAAARIVAPSADNMGRINGHRVLRGSLVPSGMVQFPYARGTILDRRGVEIPIIMTTLVDTRKRKRK